MQKLLGVVDIGTSSIKISVFECSEAGCKQVNFEGIDVRIADKSSAMISRSRRDLAIKTIQNLISFGQRSGAVDIICIATHAIRSAENARDFLAEVKAKCGLDVNVLSGCEEAALICNSIGNIERTENFFSFDVGGGSVEFNLFEGVRVFSASRGIGAISLAEILHNGHLESPLDCITQVVRENMDDIPIPRQDAKIICTGGCLSIAKTFLSASDGKTASLVNLKSLFEKIAPMNVADRLAFGIPEGRVDIFDTALGIAIAVLSQIGRDGVTISEASVRHGAALGHISFEQRWPR